jgi:hypothetical protein
MYLFCVISALTLTLSPGEGTNADASWVNSRVMTPDRSVRRVALSRGRGSGWTTILKTYAARRRF